MVRAGIRSPLVAAHPMDLREADDVTYHEHDFERSYYGWLHEIAKFLYYRGIDTGHPRWILDYASSVNETKVLAATELTARCNYYMQTNLTKRFLAKFAKNFGLHIVTIILIHLCSLCGKQLLYQLRRNFVEKRCSYPDYFMPAGYCLLFRHTFH